MDSLGRERFTFSIAPELKKRLDRLPGGSRGQVICSLLELALDQVDKHKYAAIFCITEGRAKLIIPREDKEAKDI